MAGFNTAITGLTAATTDLDVTGNNIANSSTFGFKSSRTEFGDIYATAVVGAGSSNVAGSGVTISDIAQDFRAGTIQFTNNNLDLAINGSGFFQLNDGQGGVTYTRAGAFQLNKDGFVVSKNGKFLQGYGLDAAGNRLPIGNLKVGQKESPPKATSNIDLSFNIDSRLDASKLTFPYDPNTASSFSYSTTLRTFDSLGNQHTIKYNMVERRPTRDVHSIQIPAGQTAFRISGVAVSVPAGAPTAPATTVPLSAADIAAIQAADPRIDTTTLRFDPDGASGAPGKFTFEVKAKYSDYGDFVITNTATPAVPYNDTVTERPANEVRTYDLVPPTGGAGASGEIDIAGEKIQVNGGQTELQIANLISSREAAIKARNPAVESVAVVDAGGGQYKIKITFKADQGDITPANFVVSANYTADHDPGAGTDNGPGMREDANLLVQGDNTYQGMYRMYAYLNGTQLLDLGKVQDPGEPGHASNTTEVGPVLLDFNPSTGLLRGINDVAFTPGQTAPELTIKGADPANTATTIKLDLNGSTQFASASIVKRGTQDGYTKGDLIGVTFSETGQMVASFSNSQTQNLGVVAFATFENQSGLQPAGDTEWSSTLTSGDAILNPPGTGLNGSLRSAALEQSNVDLSKELVRLIEAQRNFQANSKTLETLNTVTQAILQI